MKSSSEDEFDAVPEEEADAMEVFLFVTERPAQYCSELGERNRSREALITSG
jgi:hypothetical protein